MDSIASSLDRVLLFPDLLGSILTHLHRRNACVAACVCRTWRQAVSTLSAEPQSAFRPRLFIGCSRSCEVVDVSDLLPGNRLPLQPLPKAVHLVAGQSTKRKRNAEPSWATSIAMSPYGSRALHVCQYDVSGITRHCGGTLRSLGRLVRDTMLREPEGVTFAHGYMYVQNNWGQLVRCTLDGQVVDRMYVGGELVTWAVVAGPDDNLYISADKQYRTTVYTEVPEQATGCIMRAQLQPGGGFQAPPQPYTTVPMKRPCGLRWGSSCGTLFVTCLDPAVMRFAGPGHPSPGSLLSRIDLTPLVPGLLPWDVVVLGGHTLVVSMHKRRTLKVPQEKHDEPRRPKKRKAPSMANQPPQIPVTDSGPAGAGPSQGPGTTTEDCVSTPPNTAQLSACHSSAGQALDVKTWSVGPGGLAVEQLNPDCSYLCILSDLGQGHVTLVRLPYWMDHANMMCAEE